MAYVRALFKELDSGPHFEFNFERLMAAFCGTFLHSNAAAADILLKLGRTSERSQLLKAVCS